MSTSTMAVGYDDGSHVMVGSFVVIFVAVPNFALSSGGLFVVIVALFPSWDFVFVLT